MPLKIKWNDDRVRGATTALLLITRDRLARGATEDLIAAALADYREDPAGYKLLKATWPPTHDCGPLKQVAHKSYYQNLLSAIDRLLAKIEKSKLQFSSLRELDNWLIASLRNVR
ncbi:MAG: hypothetical protein Q8M02_09780 [Candidatus Didemnitutus sp.]|nr:hypothetical protein [Candidatus Didemnitutus sp.]